MASLDRACWVRVVRIACILTLLTTGLAACNLPLPNPLATPTAVEPTAMPEPEATETPESGLTTLTFWEPFALDRSQGLLLGEMIRDFEAENPDIAVEIVPKSGYAGIHLAMMDALPDGDLPDLGVAFPSMIAEYATTGMIAPLDAYLSDPVLGLTDQDLADIFPGYLDTGRFPGFGRQILAFPFSQNAIGMWVNETLLEQAGWDHVPATWTEFEQACYDVLANTGVSCYPFVESVSTFDAWLYSRAGQQLDVSGRKANFSEPAGVDSLVLLRRLIDAGLAWRPQAAYGDYEAFARGEAAFTFSSTGNSPLYAEEYRVALQNGVPAFRWHQAMIPQADPKNPATALYGGSFFIMQGDPVRQEAAWRLIRWFSTPQQTARWAGDLSSMPVRISALDWMTDTLETYPFFREQAEEILPYGLPEPAVPAELEIRDILYTAILSVTQGYSDPQTALDQAARDANAVLSAQP